ncbi:sensor domain-containing diguanylate cyclase [Vibrio kagoshimensis]|uniref:sensor domain-containing diguanylate cyclase n=1 Tax=Vibrio kagoshimensis TaxID=2910244 RepID=UPI003D1A140E
MLRRLNLNQLLFVTHMLLVLWLVGSFSYTRYASEWSGKIASEVRLANSSMQHVLKDVSFAARGLNYNYVATQHALAGYDETPNLFYFEVIATSKNEESYNVAWAKDVGELWNTEALFEQNDELEISIKGLRERLITASEEDKFKLTYVLDRLLDKQDRLSNHIRLENLFGNIYFEPDFTHSDYVLDLDSCLLYLKLPLLNSEGSYLWAVFDATSLTQFKIDTIFLLAREAFIAILFSIALIVWASRRIIQPIHRLAESMEGDIDSIDVDSIPDQHRSDELGKLAQRYASLIRRIQNQMLGLRRQSLFDVLTGVYSRFAYETQANLTLESSWKNDRWFGLIIIDIDNFKAYNDEFGHATGDEALQAVAKAFRTSINPHSDKVYRFGGEEFVIVCEKSSASGVSSLAELLRTNVWLKKIQHPNNGGLGFVTCSVGVSMSRSSDREVSLKALFKQADLALYQAKDSGRNQVVIAGQRNALVESDDDLQGNSHKEHSHCQTEQQDKANENKEPVV